MTDAEALRQFVAAAAELEPELARWVAAAVWRGLSPARRRRIRDEFLREAARLLPPVSAWQKAHVLAELARRPGSRPGISTAAGLVALALAVYAPERRDRALSPAQAFRILHPGRDMQVDPVVDFTVADVLFQRREVHDE